MYYGYSNNVIKFPKQSACRIFEQGLFSKKFEHKGNGKIISSFVIIRNQGTRTLYNFMK